MDAQRFCNDAFQLLKAASRQLPLTKFNQPLQNSIIKLISDFEKVRAQVSLDITNNALCADLVNDLRHDLMAAGIVDERTPPMMFGEVIIGRLGLIGKTVELDNQTKETK